jgi:glycosyltransferase involved in cell wall biosynthesis
MPPKRQFLNFPWAAPSSVAEFTYLPLISIVLPVYNQTKYLHKSIESVLNNSELLLELIVVNDGSTEDFNGTIEPYLKDPRLQVVHQENMGLSSALNNGFSLAKGSLLSWTSADNFYHPGAIQALAEYLIANPSIGVAYANVELIDENDKKLTNSAYRACNKESDITNTLLLPLTGETLSQFSDNFVNSCFMFRRNVWQQTGCYNNKLCGVEDYDFWLRASRFTRIAHIDSDRALYSYRLHSNSLTDTLNGAQLSKQTSDLVHSNARWLDYLNNGLEINITQKSNSPQTNSCLDFLSHCFTQSRHIVKISSDNSGCNLPDNVNNFALEIALTGLADYLMTGKRTLDCSPNQSIMVTKKVSASYISADLNTSTYLHQTHIELHPQQISSIIAFNTLTEVQKKFVALPPINYPEILKRSRDNNYGAVTANKNNLGTFLIFAPDYTNSDAVFWSLKTISELISSYPKFTFVLLCQTTAQKQSADNINLSLSSNKNLRIIDISSAPSISPREYHQNPNIDLNTTRQSSLMYVLSSVDAIISIKAPELDLKCLLEVRCEAAMAAMAGLNCAVICNRIITNKSTEHELLSLTLPIPNVGIGELTSRNSDIPSFLALSLKRPDLRTLEQWLDLQSAQKISKNLVALLTD